MTMFKKIIRNKAGRVAVVSAALMMAMPVVSAGAQAASTKAGDKCTKAQYGKSTKTGANQFKCTYSTKTKRYTWTLLSAAPTTVPAIDLTKLDKTGWPAKFVVGGVPADQVAVMQTKWSGLINLFKDELGIPVEFYPGTSYAAVIEASIANKVDMVAWGAMSYIVAKQNGAKIEPLGITQQTGGTTFYTSRLITRTTSGISSIAGVRGKTVCFVAETSTSGNLVPTEGVLAAGLTTGTYTKRFSGTHTNSMVDLNNNQCDAAFMQEATWASVGTAAGGASLSGITASDFKEIWKSGPIPNGPFTIRGTLPTTFKAAVKNILLTKLNKDYFISKGYNGCTSSSCIIVEDASTTGFIAVTDSYYDTIRKVCEATKSTACKA